jgi:hypothetical protein
MVINTHSGNQII